MHIKDYKRKVVIRGEPEGLRVAGSIFAPSDEGRFPSLAERGRKFYPVPYAVVRIADEGSILYVVAHKGVIPGEPDLWSLGVSCPVSDEMPRWQIRRLSPAGKASPEMHIVLGMDSTVEVLGG